MTDHQQTEQLQLDVELREPVPSPRWDWALLQETEGDQDTGWWDA